MNILPGNMRFGAGQPVKRLEDQRLLTGKGQFIDDKPEDGALWLHVLRSPHAHAKIVSVDTKAAAAMPGVQAVYTGADLVADDIGTIPTLSVFKRPDGKPMTVPPRRLLAHEIVRFAGEPVAAVVATSRVAAQTAAEAIAVEYEMLPSVVDPDCGDQARRAGGVGGSARQYRRRHELWRRRPRSKRRSPTLRIKSRSISSASGWCRRRWSRARPSPRSTRNPAG